MQALISAASFLCEDVEAHPCGSEGLRILKNVHQYSRQVVGISCRVTCSKILTQKIKTNENDYSWLFCVKNSF